MSKKLIKIMAEAIEEADREWDDCAKPAGIYWQTLAEASFNAYEEWHTINSERKP